MEHVSCPSSYIKGGNTTNPQNPCSKKKAQSLGFAVAGDVLLAMGVSDAAESTEVIEARLRDETGGRGDDGADAGSRPAVSDSTNKSGMVMVAAVVAGA